MALNKKVRSKRKHKDDDRVITREFTVHAQNMEGIR